jgi:hypothetical protein
MALPLAAFATASSNWPSLYANAFLGFAGGPTNAGEFNTASGFQALYSNTTGTDNTVTGTQALYSNTIGVDNTVSGTQALLRRHQ